MKVIRKLKYFIKVFLSKELKFKKVPPFLQSIKLGSEYGGWYVPTGLLNENSICYSAGAGEDISFDVELAKMCQCTVLIFDPTPKAKAHFDKVIHSMSEGKSYQLNEHFTYNGENNLNEKLVFKNIGIWKENDNLKFYSPKNKDHVSHSISNIQNTSNFFEAHVDRLSNIMKANGHKKLDLFKMDIEGAEYEVIDSILQDNIEIKVLCIEFHKTNNSIKIIQEAINKLENKGYRMFAREHLDISFIRM
ncbi:MAG TPA: FkbM family methyltransferase [Flavisolibacter sp.]|jgi:FkbM family methyltransferase|nr:FkbM family methyltransferase [Flavisolibacter sp.]